MREGVLFDYDELRLYPLPDPVNTGVGISRVSST